MKVICSYCGKHYKDLPGPEYPASHGYCERHGEMDIQANRLEIRIRALPEGRLRKRLQRRHHRIRSRLARIYQRRMRREGENR